MLPYPRFSHDFPRFPTISRPPPPPRSNARTPSALLAQPHDETPSAEAPGARSLLSCALWCGMGRLWRGMGGMGRPEPLSAHYPHRQQGLSGFHETRDPRHGYCLARGAGCPLGRREFRGFHETRITRHETRLFFESRLFLRNALGCFVKLRLVALGSISATISLGNKDGSLGKREVCDRIMQPTFPVRDGKHGMNFFAILGLWPKFTSCRRKKNQFMAPNSVAVLAVLGAALVCAPKLHSADPGQRLFAGLADEYRTEVRPIMRQFCLGCHSTAARVGELDLERFATLAEVRGDTKTWLKVVEMLDNGEMPPESARPPSSEQRTKTARLGRTSSPCRGFGQCRRPGTGRSAAAQQCRVHLHDPGLDSSRLESGPRIPHRYARREKDSRIPATRSSCHRPC